MSKRVSKEGALIVERYFELWLECAEEGQAYVRKFGFEGAMDALWELLNTGFIKLEGDGERITGIAPRMPPRPPATAIQRPRRRRASISQ